ncbi:MAG: type II toxin-antitoxin system TacA family antitoxin [Hyphomicrobium sp.]
MTATRPIFAKVPASAKAARLEARISHDQKDLLERAALIAGRSLTDFVINSAQEAATRTIRDHEMVSLSARDSRAFVAAILGASKPSARLRKAAQRYKRAMAR